MDTEPDSNFIFTDGAAEDLPGPWSPEALAERLQGGPSTQRVAVGGIIFSSRLRKPKFSDVKYWRQLWHIGSRHARSRSLLRPNYYRL